MGGLRGRSNSTSWLVAGTLAYYLWVKPSQELKRQQEEKPALAALDDPYKYVEKRKPIPDPQVIGIWKQEQNWQAYGLVCFLPHNCTRDKCGGCTKTVYPTEKVSVNGAQYHQSYFKCSHGGCTISPLQMKENCIASITTSNSSGRKETTASSRPNADQIMQQ